jgi:2'-5' RNA ligase
MEQILPHKIRVFVALFPPIEIVSQLEAAQTKLRKRLPTVQVGWTRPEQLHLTLNFLGNIRSDLLSDFQEAFRKVASEGSELSLQCRGLGCFPAVRQPKVVWAGLNGDLAELEKLKYGLDTAFAPLGIVRETRSFHPHLTLGRVKHFDRKRALQMTDAMAEFEGTTFGAWRVQTISFMRSILSSAGSSYSPLDSFSLK